MDTGKKIALCIIACIFLVICTYLLFNRKSDEYLPADVTVISDLAENSEEGNSEADDDNNIKEEDMTIRVLLSNQGDYYQTKVKISCDTDYIIEAGDEILQYEVGTEVDITTFAEETIDVITASPADEDGKITVLTLNKDEGNPCYRGKLYIYADEKGYYIVNELPLEEYLYSVVSSEMPSSYETEALKAQAVCARTYAVKKMSENKFEKYNADIDDTTSTQVYNNIGETDAAINAVDETEGIIMTSDGEPIDAYFFSTSCGTTCRNDDVWGGSKQAYLNDSLEAYGEEKSLSETAVMVNSSGLSLKISEGVLSSEEIFKQFINNEIYFDAIDGDASLYRWSVTYSEEQMENALYEGIYDLICKNSDDLEITDKNGKKENFYDIESIDDLKSFLGEIEKTEVSKRGYSGIVQSMVIYASNTNIFVENQLTIREIFNPSDTEIINQDGESLSGWSMLPSAYFYIEVSADGAYTIYGGGFGHGVGMSQNGANALAKKGYTCEDILGHYFDGVDFENINETGY